MARALKRRCPGLIVWPRSHVACIMSSTRCCHCCTLIHSGAKELCRRSAEQRLCICPHCTHPWLPAWLQEAAAGSDDAAALRPKKQRQPQRRRPAGQPCGGPAAAAEAPPADGLDPGLVARLAAQRQQKFGCCGGQKGVARTCGGVSPPADKDRVECQPQQQQPPQPQQRPPQQARSLLASVSLQVIHVVDCRAAIVLLLCWACCVPWVVVLKRQPSKAIFLECWRATAVLWRCAGSRPVCGAGFHAPPKAAAHKGTFLAQPVSSCAAHRVFWV